MKVTQHYTYDKVGNIVELQHVATTGSYTRTYDIDTGSNRLLETAVGMTTYEYDYDARGNMVEMPHLSSMVWNMNNELSSIVKGIEPTHYQYSNGQRVRKYTNKGSVKEERIYLGNYEIYRKFDNTSSLTHSTGSVRVLERTTVHISDDTGRIAMLEERTIGTDPSPATLQRYIYSNHLQSASLELDEFGEVISYEEYHPYGTTSYQAMNASINAVAKRYKYTGKERDDESGLYYHGARYYIPWLCRWSAVDVKQSEMPTWSPYNYGFCNPVKWTDKTGMQPEEKDPPKSLIEGEAVAYTTTINTYDHNNILIEIQSETKFVPIEELPPDSIRGEYIRNIYLPDPNKTTIKDGNLTVSNIGYQTNEFIPYNFSSDEKLMEYPSSQGESFLESAWNSTLARTIIPDKISFSAGGDFAYGIGVGAQPINISILTRGKDPGIYLTPTLNAYAGYGGFVSGGFEFTISHYNDNPRNISASMLQGDTYGVMATGGYLGSLSVGESYSPTNRSGTTGFFNTSVGVGLGYGLFIGGQYQHTPGHAPIWQWKK